mmetsp:Transcript_729/g.1926  ORF Transcript_729/g.1926 Transcript_729/m.1926 type:complete len:200 (-) Transcript_729:368-967(-)
MRASPTASCAAPCRPKISRYASESWHLLPWVVLKCSDRSTICSGPAESSSSSSLSPFKSPSICHPTSTCPSSMNSRTRAQAMSTRIPIDQSGSRLPTVRANESSHTWQRGGCFTRAYRIVSSISDTMPTETVTLNSRASGPLPWRTWMNSQSTAYARTCEPGSGPESASDAIGAPSDAPAEPSCCSMGGPADELMKPGS